MTELPSESNGESGSLVEPIAPSEEEIDEAIAESFPASDAPPWWAGPTS